MSRIGKMKIDVPAGVTVKCEDRLVTVTGPKGTLSQKIENKNIVINIAPNEVTVDRTAETKDARACHGLYRQLINNMVKGVVTPFTKTLNVQGVGFKASVQGNKLVLNIGYSHPVEFIAPNGITISCGDSKTVNSMAITPVTISGIDKVLVGQVAATIKSKRPVEPYHNYGLHYVGETLIKKEGKTAGK